ncbi:pre-B-cell leukemia transcription factor-interacting protein 1-like [Megalops cyprinoides]|uniref:pre-B-cell leukemia transcription factor-interacting protein 1-like n=1 Tax=Megalops cyprinoides TaxID=118141 RepID=UPI0018646145|nr:pre-B-cell leukemia transcription factor-interacting protein 1-like [Megalops cyprinoides]
MSDNNNGFNNSWTILTPEETAVGNVGPRDDGSESLADAPGLSEEVTGTAPVLETADAGAKTETAVTEEGLQVTSVSSETDVVNIGPGNDGSEGLADTPGLAEEVTGKVAELRTGDSEAPTELVLSEEGLQVCQETAPEITQSPAPPSPSPSSHVPLSASLETHTPFSPEPDAYTVTTPYSDSHPAVSPTSDSWTHISPAVESITLATPVSDTYTDISPSIESHTPVSPPSDIYTHISPPTESPTIVSSTSDTFTDTSTSPEIPAFVSPTSDTYADVSPAPEVPAPVSPDSFATLSTPASQEEEVLQYQEEVSEPAKTVSDVGPCEDYRGDTVFGEEEGLRRRHVQPASPPDLPVRAGAEEEDEEEEEFRLVERKEEGGLSLNKCIVGALILLSLGSIIFSGIFIDLEDEDDSEVAQLRDPKNPDAKPPTPQEVTELLGKLAEENQQMTLLQAQLQSQKEELNLVLQRAEEMGKEPPAGQTENQSSTVQEGPGTREEKDKSEGGRIWQESGKEKVLTEERKTREGDAQIGAREPERRWTEGEERRGGKKKHWEGGQKEGRREGFQEKDWKKGREEGKEWKHRVDKKERKGESDWKRGKDGGKDKHKEWVEKKERKQVWEKEKERERESPKHGERKREGSWKDKMEKKDHRDERWRKDKKEKDWKPHKDGWKTEKDGSTKKREERGMGKDKIRKERHWQGTVEKAHHRHTHADYWKHQREELENNRPPVDCRGISECARKEGLVPVKLDEFLGVFEGYLSKLGGAAGQSKEAIIRLVREFFIDGVFVHHKMPFREFVEDVADMLEDVVEGDREAEEKMDEFEREALRRFTLPGGGEREGRKRGKESRMWG